MIRDKINLRAIESEKFKSKIRHRLNSPNEIFPKWKIRILSIQEKTTRKKKKEKLIPRIKIQGFLYTYICIYIQSRVLFSFRRIKRTKPRRDSRISEPCLKRDTDHQVGSRSH